MAWQTAALLNIQRAKGQKAITAEDLLGRPLTDSKKKSVKRRTAQEAARERRVLRELGDKIVRPKQ